MNRLYLTALMLAALLFAVPTGPVQAAQNTLQSSDSDETGSDKVVVMPEVVVTATMREQSIERAPGTVQVITQSEIASIGAETVADVLREAAGVMVISSTSRSQEISIRGLGSGHTLILVDGQRLAGGYNAIVDANQIPVTMVERIEVVRGPGSALYGSEATGGVVNIITRTPPEKTEAELDLRGACGPSAEQWIQGMAGGPVGQLRVNVAASHIIKDGWDGDGELPDDIDDTTLDTVYARETLDIDESRTLSVGQDWNSFTREGRRFYKNLERDRDAEDEREGGFIQYDIRENGRYSGMVRIYGNQSDGSYDFTPAAEAMDKERSLMQAESRFSWFTSDSLILTGGGEMRKETLEGDEMNSSAGDEESEKVGAVYSQLEWFPGSDTGITACLRYDSYDSSGSHVTPRLTASHYLPFGRIWGSYGEGFRAPALDELYGKVSKNQGKYIYFGNEELEPELSEGYETGIEFRKSMISTRIVYFRNDLEDLIATNLINSDGQYKSYSYENVDNASTSGVEVEAGVDIAKDVRMSAQSTWLDTENEDTGLDLAYEPDWKGNIILAWKIPVFNIESRVSYLYFGTCEDGDGNELDGYDLVNLYFTKKINRQLQLYAGLDNLFKEENSDFIQSPLQVYGGVRMTF